MVKYCNHALKKCFLLRFFEISQKRLDFLKNAFINCPKYLFNDFANKKQIFERIKEMPLTTRTVPCRIEDMSKIIDTQVKNDCLITYLARHSTIVQK